MTDHQTPPPQPHVAPYAATTTDYLGCEYMSQDVSGIEKIAASGSMGPTEVIYLYAGSAPATAQVSVGIKPLDWQGYEARSAAGQYRVQRLDDKWEPLHAGYYMLPKHAGVVSAFDTEEEAKAYAQADYETRIRAALAATSEDHP
jgi:hypothetical protein